ECPSGAVTEEDFKMIFNQFFPQGVEKIQWIFNLYDINGDNYITKNEMLIIANAIYDMLGCLTKPKNESKSIEERVDEIFEQMDANKDGVISYEEFCEWCQN
ncbi:hypothetical protein B4U79_06586, partial [Dinothrombium tinctorium]